MTMLPGFVLAGEPLDLTGQKKARILKSTSAGKIRDGKEVVAVSERKA